MGSDLFAAFLMLLLAVSGGNPAGGRASDLLDLIPTASYWRVKGVTVSREQLQTDVGVAAKVAGDVPSLVKNLESLSKRDAAKKQLEEIGAPALEALRAETHADDPEAVAMAKELVTSIAQHGKVNEVRRLMAIRTLGERKEVEALPLLKSLADSKEMFVAEYAARAAAAIEGTAVKAVDHRGEIAGDLNLFPAETGIVGQTTGIGAPGFNLEALVGMMESAKAAGRDVPPGAPMPAAGAANAEAVDKMTKQWLDYVDAVGNVRVDGVTVAVSSGIGGNANEWFAVSVHGQYDREAVAAFMQGMAHGTAQLMRDGNVISLHMDREAIIEMPSDKQLLLVVADPDNTPVATIAAPILAAIVEGKPNTLADNKALDAVLKAVDKSGPLWVAAIPSGAMRQASLAAPFDTITLSLKEEKDVISLTAVGSGTGDIRGAVGQIDAARDTMVDTVGRMSMTVKDLVPLLEAAKSMKVVVDGEKETATATATMSREITKSLIFGLMSLTAGQMEEVGPPMNVPANLP